MKKYFGTKEFYRAVAVLALPLLLQNAVSTFVNLLDNLMVGQLGTEAMSGVSIVNQILFVYNLCLFGGTGGASIYGAQFHGRGEHEGVRHALRFNIWLSIIFTALAAVVLTAIPDALIRAFLHDSGNAESIALTFSEGKKYLNVMLFGLPAFALTSSYVSIVRVTGDNKLPMKASITAIFVNFVFNYLLIYGKFGFPALGVTGAAIATVLSRYVELFIILAGTHGRREKPELVRGLYATMRIPRQLCLDIIKKGLPLLANEALWSFGITMLTQCYSYRGLAAIAAMNICNTAGNLFNTVFFTMGNVVAIMLGNKLGAEDYDGAAAACRQLLTLSFLTCAAVGALQWLAAPWMANLYKTSDEIITLAAGLMRVHACLMPFAALTNCTYWALRAGGRTGITMIFDSIFTWVVMVPTAWSLIHLTELGLLGVFALVNLAEQLKLAIGVPMLKKGVWLNNLVADKEV